MRNKNAIIIFAILLFLACIYQLSFTWVSRSVDKKAEKAAKFRVDSLLIQNPKLSLDSQNIFLTKFKEEYLLANAHTEVYPVFGTTLKDCKKHEINLGLDLQGGMNVILEVSLIDLVKVLSGYSTDPTFNQALSDAAKMQRERQEDYVTLFGEAFSNIDPNAKLAAIFHTRDNKDKFPRDATNEEIIDIIKGEADDAVDRTEQVIRKRIDNLGVVQPNVQKLEGSGRILVELPGVKNKTRVRKLLQGTAKLEFWETFENTELYTSLAGANELLRKRLSGTHDTIQKDSVNLGNDNNNNSESGLNTLFNENEDTTELNEDSSDQEETNLLEELKGSKQGDTTSKADSSKEETEQSFEDFAKENPLFAILRPILVQDPGSKQYYPGKGPSCGYAHIKDTSAVNTLLKRKDILSKFPPRIKFVWAAKPYDESEEYLQLYALKVTTRDSKARLEGDAVTNARVEADPMGNPEVSLIMNSDGAQTWRLMTKENIGKSIAIVLDNLVYSAPTVQGEISGGRSSITGRFTQEEAADLANVLKAGKLPAPSKIIEEAVVGPSLGHEAISSGLRSFLIALCIVLIYMWFYYSRAGAVSDVALFVNLFFVIGVLASLGATLTLPGIAGIVLTIGMSVDANVLIYERIREETNSGKGLHLALVDGYKAAYSSIIDANITTLLTGIILAVFGTGPIKGFATTLIIGILTSLFSAIFITRLLFEWMLNKNVKITFANKLTANSFKKANFGFVKNRRIFYVVSSLIVLCGLISLVFKGLNQGVDFTGGRSYIVRFEHAIDVEQIRKTLGNAIVTKEGIKLPPEVKIFGADNQVKITTKFLIEDDSENVDELVEAKLNEGLLQTQDKFEIMSSQKVGPTIADDIKVSAAWAIFFSLLIIFLYLLMRFKKWQYGLGALVALIHDVMITIGIFSIFYGILPFSLEIDQAFIAAILTVVGYSINDTVVVFDRIREYLGIYKRKDTKEIINKALNNTLSRTVNTSLTTFFVLLMIFIFGGEVIRGFVFALMVGVIVGTYSSVCIATPVVVDFTKQKSSKDIKKR